MEILKALKEPEVRPAAEVARKLGIAPGTLYQWKAKTVVLLPALALDDPPPDTYRH